MEKEEFKKRAHELVDWMTDYLIQKENYPVIPQVAPRVIFNQIPDAAPEQGESFDAIMADFKEIIVSGMSHWQHPAFFGYFSANNSEPSILAEMLISTLGSQCMSWLTSPAATELEERVCDWLRDAKGIDKTWKGCIHDTASTATLSALLAAREKVTDYQINENGFQNEKRFRVYSSSHTHSSIDKSLKIIGLFITNLVRIPVDKNFAMISDELEKAILEDLENGFHPICIVFALGTTSSTAVDPIDEISQIAHKYQIWHHIDAAFAGTAQVMPEYQSLMEGHELADNYLFNLHKWMFTNFDCTIMYLKESRYLVNTFSITFEYLKAKLDEEVNNYRDWGIPLGRRFRALKLWFVSFGQEGIWAKIRNYIQLAHQAKSWIEVHQSGEFSSG